MQFDILDMEDEYRCEKCGTTFKFMPKGKKKPVCPACKSTKATKV
jgi:putative FmdB family regulatory protein